MKATREFHQSLVRLSLVNVYRGCRNEIERMNDKRRANLERMEGRTFILGREGHIYIDSPTASKHHAEICIEDGKVILRDLKSTNGTF